MKRKGMLKLSAIVAAVFLLFVGALTGCDSAATNEDNSQIVGQENQENNKQDEADTPENPDESGDAGQNEENSTATENDSPKEESDNTNLGSGEVSLSQIPAYSGYPYVMINNNIPGFTKDQLSTTSYEYYSELDSLGRCGTVYACIGTDLLPTEERGSIGSVKPTGWHLVKYDCVDGNYLYNRCHLIGYQLTGENANEKNLITGTRYMNVDGMLPFEDLVADYIKETGHHVMYRVTPIYDENDLVAQGVQMEAYSVEDNGAGICYNVFVYNVQPGVTINYTNGESCLASTGDSHHTEEDSHHSNQQGTTDQEQEKVEKTYILNKNTHKFHDPSCRHADNIKEENREEYTGDRDDLIEEGYEPCKVCNP